ncbi:hypothetical protein NMY22_g1116 [Coprinellus aureogranulatus]|nr:hypothetical protein NMY22_g1116 [Coprinellus aureogranulatus]
MPITPHDLVQEWEKAGLIDKLRQELMAKYKDSEEFEKFASQVREATTQTFSEAVIGSLPLPELIQHMSQEAIRDSMLESTIQNSAVLADPTLEANVRPALERILRRKRMAELRAAQGQGHSLDPTPTPVFSGTPAHFISTPSHSISTPAHPTSTPTTIATENVIEGTTSRPVLPPKRFAPETETSSITPLKSTSASADAPMDVDKPASS